MPPVPSHADFDMQHKKVNEVDNESTYSADASPTSNDLYSNRLLKPAGIYHQLQRVFKNPQYIAHPNCLVGVRPFVERNGNVIWMKGDKPFQAIILGEMVSELEGSKLTAKGNMFPATDPVRRVDSSRWHSADTEQILLKKKIKQVFCIRCPTLATDDITSAFDVGVQRLDDMTIEYEGGMAQMTRTQRSGVVRSWPLACSDLWFNRRRGSERQTFRQALNTVDPHQPNTDVNGRTVIYYSKLTIDATNAFADTGFEAARCRRQRFSRFRHPGSVAGGVVGRGSARSARS